MGSPWAMTATKSGGEGGFEKAPPGNHPAVMVAIVDMGTQTVDGYQGAPAKDQHRAYLVWELVGEPAAGTSRNHTIGIDMNLSLNEKAKLRKWVEAWTGKPIGDGGGFDISTLLGKSCLLNVIEKNGYPKVDGVGAVPKGMAVPSAQNKPVAYTLGDLMGGATPPDWLPYLFGRPILDHVRESKEWAAAGLPAGPQPGPPGGNPAAAKAPPPPPVARPAPPPPPKAAQLWWLTVDGVTTPDPVPESRIIDLIREGMDPVAALVCAVGSDQWRPASEAIPAARSVIPF